MGWSTGSSLMSDIIRHTKDSGFDFETRKLMYETLIHCFIDYDCDTLHECKDEDPAFDFVWNELYPEEPDEEENEYEE